MKQKGGIIQLTDAEQNVIYCCLSLLFSPKSLLTLCDPLDCSLPGSSVPRISQARILEWVAISFSGDPPDPGMEPTSPALAGGLLTTEPLGKPYNILSSTKSTCHFCRLKKIKHLHTMWFNLVF